MIYRVPGFLAVVWFCSSPTPWPPPPHSSASKLDRRHRKTEKERQVADGKGGWEQNHTTGWSLILFKSFNTLWANLSDLRFSMSVEPAHLLPAEVLTEIKLNVSHREQMRGEERLSFFLICKSTSNFFSKFYQIRDGAFQVPFRPMRTSPIDLMVPTPIQSSPYRTL